MRITTEAKDVRMLNPVHPGPFLRSEIIEAYGLSITEAAKLLGVSRPTLSSLLNAKADLSGDMALRFEKGFGVGMDTLMRMQNSYDIAKARKRAKAIHVERYKPRHAA
ncbi:MAG: HigA family addiction module antitoxin [Bryobacteraceae bacterium]